MANAASSSEYVNNMSLRRNARVARLYNSRIVAVELVDMDGEGESLETGGF